jgi:hypothetical protein
MNLRNELTVHTWIEQAMRRRRSRLAAASPPSFVWHEHRTRPNWLFTCCVALACGVGGYYLATLSKPEAQEQLRSEVHKMEMVTGVQEKDANQKPEVVAKTHEETRATVPPVVVLNPGTAESVEKSDRPQTTISAAPNSSSRATPGARRNGDDRHHSSRSRPTSYRSYKDLRDFTLNR